MNRHFRAARLLDGVSLSGAARPGVMLDEKCRFQELRKRRRARRAAAPERAEDGCVRIEEPARFHRVRYEHLTLRLRGKCQVATALVTFLSLMVLGWRAGGGEHLSPERWLCGLLSGWFLVCMFRIALFTCLAAPRFVSFSHGRLQVSGLGRLKKGQILYWSIEPTVLVEARAPRGARLTICHRWFGWERHWTMLMEEGPETERLQSLLEAQLPRAAAAPPAPPMRRTIQIEAGMLSH
jgi:hypothetical protein